MNSKLRTCSSDISEVPVLHEASHPGVQEAGLLPPQQVYLVCVFHRITQVYEVPERETLLPIIGLNSNTTTTHHTDLLTRPGDSRMLKLCIPIEKNLNKHNLFPIFKMNTPIQVIQLNLFLSFEFGYEQH